jgi:hypothetical protein
MMREIHDALVHIENLLRELLAVARERPPAPEITVTVTVRA